MATIEAESAETASVREENQRLDKLVRQQKAGASPAEKARTPRVERSQNQTPQNLGGAQREISQLRDRIQQLQQEAQTAREELEAARQREGDTAECLMQCRTEKQTLESQVEVLTVQLDQCRAEKSTVERNMELLTAQFAEMRRGGEIADERATLAEAEVQRLISVLSRQQEEAELQRYRSLAAQEEKWEAREKRLEQQLQEQMERGKRLEAELQECRQRQDVSCVPEGSATERARRVDKQETARVQKSPPPLVRCPDAMPSPDLDARGEQLSRDSPLQFAHTLNSITQLHLPPIPEFSGDDQSLTNNSFQQWLEQFEMVSELAQWPENIKLKQLALRLRGSAQAYFRTCSEEQKHDYQALVQAMSQRFTPVRIQALECSTFHERKQGKKETVDTYAQELQRLFQRAYPSAVHGNPDAQEMGQAVLSSQFVSGLTPQIKRKIAYLEGATFSELWQKARFEEARLRDLENATNFNPAPKKYYTPIDDRQGENPYQRNPPLTRDPPRQPRPGDRNQTIVCFKCRQPGHVARNCRQGTRFPEASGRQNAPRTAAITPDSERIQQAKNASDTPADKASKWMHGVCHASLDGDSSKQNTFQSIRLGPTPKIPVTVEGIEVEALVDTGCPATIISKTLCHQILDGGHNQENPAALGEHRCQMEKKLHLNEPSLQLHAYCGSQLSIGAEITVNLKAGEYQANAVVLVQENTPVDLLLGTNLMPKLGIQVLDTMGQSLLNDQENLTSPVTTEESLDLNNSSQQPLPAETPQFATEKDTSSNTASKSKQPSPCRTISGSLRKVPGSTNQCNNRKQFSFSKI